MDLSIGQIVYSKSGRDKGRIFIILNIEGYYLYLADGKLRTATKPKKKKVKHIQPTKEISEAVANIISKGMLLKDSDIRAALKNAGKA